MTIFTEVKNQLLNIPVQATGVTVNSVGVMGAGLAKHFLPRHPRTNRLYQEACKAGKVKPGQVIVKNIENDYPENQKGPLYQYLVYWVTKNHWRDGSKYQWIRECLKRAPDLIASNRIETIMIPPLGCGLGGLEYGLVKEMIYQTPWPSCLKEIYVK